MEPLTSWLTLPKKVAWPIVVVTGILLWGPEPLAKGLGLDLFLEKYRIWVGVAFLFFLVTALLPVIPWCASVFRDKTKRHLLRKRRLELVRKLTPEEKALIRQFTDGNTKALDLNIQNGVVGRLLKIGFLALASQASYGGRRGSFTFPVNISDWLWDELQDDPKHLDN